MSKYEDLAEAIHNDGIDAYWDEILAVLRWLDEHPDQVPGRTITTTQLRAGMKAEGIAEGEEFEQFWTGTLGNFGITVVPDPEPTNAEKLEQLYSNWSQSTLNPPFGEWADSIGVKAPGGDDD